jgi:integrase
LQASELDELYEELSEKISPTLATSVHQVLVACLGTALRTRKLVRNPIVELAKVPERGKVNHGQALDDTQLQTLVQGFKGTTLYPVVAVAAFTGARRNEILSLRWEDLNITEGTLRIARTLEETLAYGLRTKEPKSERGKRVVRIDDRLLALLFEERERHLRVAAGLPDGTQADLSLIKLPAGALMFPNPPPPGESFSFTRFRNPRVVTAAFVRKAAALGFPGLRFHDLRGSHETLLLDRGVPVHVVAARCGHDPAVLLRSYAKRHRKSDDAAAEIIAAISKGALR